LYRFYMHRIKHIAIIFCLLVALPAVAQFKSDLVQSRILILLDESSSMVQKWNGDKAKYAAAHEIILRIMDSVYAYNADVEFSLRVFGHQHTVQENDCHDTRNEVAFSKGNRNQMDFRLTDIHPLGVTPIAYALSQAAEYDLVDEQHNAYSIILITDGGESCGGDICEVMRTLIANKVFFKPYIVGLEDAPELRSSYACMGNFLSVTKEGDVPDAVSKIVTGFKPIIKVTKSEYKEIKELSANAPSILKVNPPHVVEVPPPAPAPRPVAKVTSINHLVIASEKLSELPIAEPDKLKVAAVPAPPADIVAIPTAPQIEHILNASIHELPGATLQLVPVRKAVIPDVIEPIELPATNSIDHILPASLKELILTTVAPRIVSVQAVPFITELKLDHPELPKVTSINHLSPAYHNYVMPVPEQVSVRKRQPEPVVITEAPQLPVVSPISHIAAAKISVMDHAEASVAPLPLVKPLSPPVEERETASLPVVAKINHIKPAGSVEKDNTPVAFASLVKVANNVPEVDIKDVPSTERISRQKPAKMMEPRVIFIIEDHPLKLRTPPDPPSFTPMPSAALLASKPSLAPAKPPRWSRCKEYLYSRNGRC